MMVSLNHLPLAPSHLGRLPSAASDQAGEALFLAVGLAQSQHLAHGYTERTRDVLLPETRGRSHCETRDAVLSSYGVTEEDGWLM